MGLQIENFYKIMFFLSVTDDFFSSKQIVQTLMKCFSSGSSLFAKVTGLMLGA